MTKVCTYETLFAPRRVKKDMVVCFSAEAILKDFDYTKTDTKTEKTTCVYLIKSCLSCFLFLYCMQPSRTRFNRINKLF